MAGTAAPHDQSMLIIAPLISTWQALSVTWRPRTACGLRAARAAAARYHRPSAAKMTDKAQRPVPLPITALSGECRRQFTTTGCSLRFRLERQQPVFGYSTGREWRKSGL